MPHYVRGEFYCYLNGQDDLNFLISKHEIKDQNTRHVAECIDWDVSPNAPDHVNALTRILVQFKLVGIISVNVITVATLVSIPLSIFCSVTIFIRSVLSYPIGWVSTGSLDGGGYIVGSALLLPSRTIWIIPTVSLIWYIWLSDWANPFKWVDCPRLTLVICCR